MLTVDFARFPIGPGDRVLDLGCGGGRHGAEALRRGAQVVALDRDAGPAGEAAATLGALLEPGAGCGEGPVPGSASATAVRGDALALPFPDGAFDRVIAAEVLEHLPADDRAVAEIARVARPGGLVVVTVPRWWPELLCWLLSERYHDTAGGHVRIYTSRELTAKLARAGLRVLEQHHVHALHSLYWWLRCVVGIDREDHPLPRTYHRLLVWDITARPWLTRAAERVLDPVAGKSLVTYLRKPDIEDARSGG